MTTDPGRAWAAAAAAIAIPQPILDAAPTTPWGFEPATFAARADAAIEREEDTPSDACAREVLAGPAARGSGVVLDVGCGVGAGSLALFHDANRLVGVDPSEVMLAEFTRRAARLGVMADAVVGTWPDAADRAGTADVVLAHHVVHDVADIEPFLLGLHEAAAHRVVLELTTAHPLTWLTPYWKALHDWERPDGTNADLLLEVLGHLGIEAQSVTWPQPMFGTWTRPAWVARKLCIGQDRHDALAAAMAADPPPQARDVTTIWWDR